MSYFVLNTGEQALGVKSPLVKATDRATFANAVELLAYTEQLKSQIDDAYSAAKERGYADGLAAGNEAVRGEFQREILELAKSIAAADTARNEHIAAAAIAGAQAIVGAIDQTDAMRGIIDQVIKRIDKDQAITVHIHPDHHTELAANGKFPANVALVSNGAFGPTDCEIVTANGKVIANMDLQLAGLAQRWGVTDSNEVQDNE